VIYSVLYGIKSDTNYVINLCGLNETYPSIYIKYIGAFERSTIWHYAPGEQSTFFSKCHVENDTTYVIADRNNRQSTNCFFLRAYLRRFYKSRQQFVFLNDHFLGVHILRSNFCIKWNSMDKARVTQRTRHAGAYLRHWQSCRSAGGPNSNGNNRVHVRGENRAALLGEDCCQSILSNALHGQLVTSVCVGDSHVVICSEWSCDVTWKSNRARHRWPIRMSRSAFYVRLWIKTEKSRVNRHIY
jgi:hypothetical protein